MRPFLWISLWIICHSRASYGKIANVDESVDSSVFQLKAANSALAAMEKAALASMKKHGDEVQQGPQLPGQCSLISEL